MRRNNGCLSEEYGYFSAQQLASNWPIIWKWVQRLRKTIGNQSH